jgi:type IV secretory pathway VirB10-like protein
MQRIAFACAALMILASPAGAQQAPPDQSFPTAPEQAVPPAPPPPRQSELPAPFVPPPPARVYDYHPSRAHHRIRTHSRALTHRHRSRRQRSTQKRHGSIHISKHASRQCHRMSYVQIVRHSTCRALMSRDLRAAEHRHSQVSRHHRSHRHRMAQHHRARRDRG